MNHVIIRYFIFILLLLGVPSTLWGQNQSFTAQPSPYLDQQYPTQQFVIGESEERLDVVSNFQPQNGVNIPQARTSVQQTPPSNPIAVTGTTPLLIPNPDVPSNSIGASPNYPTLDQQFPPPTKSPAVVQYPNSAALPTSNMPTTPINPSLLPTAPATAPVNPPPPAPMGPTAMPMNPPLPTPIGSISAESTPPAGLFDASAAMIEDNMPPPQKPFQIFQGGLEERAFIQCQKMSASVCARAKTQDQFNQCMALLKPQSGCAQFLAFAALARFSIKDDMDVFQQYPEGAITLIHLTRGGTNYPGDYFIIGDNGSFTNVNSGAEAQAINIRRDPYYQTIALRYPQVQLWSLIDKQPKIEPLAQGGGVRVIFSFELRNGCATCDLAGFAEIAYDFAPNGALKRVSLLKLREV